MVEELKEYLIVARDISIKILIIIAVLYVIYKIIRYIVDVRRFTLEIMEETLFNRKSYIQVTSNLKYLRKHFSNKSQYSDLKDTLLSDGVDFIELIDSYHFKKRGYYNIFAEFEDAAGKRKAELARIKLNLIGAVTHLEILDKTGQEIEYLIGKDI